MNHRRWSLLKTVLMMPSKAFQSRQVMKPKNVQIITCVILSCSMGTCSLSLQHSTHTQILWLRSGSASLISQPWSSLPLPKIRIQTGLCCLQWLPVIKQKPLACHQGNQLSVLCLWMLHKPQINRLFALFSTPAPGLRWGKVTWACDFLVKLQDGSRQAYHTFSRA